MPRPHLYLLLALAAAFGISHFSDRIDPYYLDVLTGIGINVILAVSLNLVNGYSGQFSLGHAGFMAVGAYLAAYPAKFHAHLSTDGPERLLIDHPFGVLLFVLNLGLVLAAGGGLLFGLLSLIRITRRLQAQVPAILM